jgi:hypothetical protein
MEIWFGKRTCIEFVDENFQANLLPKKKSTDANKRHGRNRAYDIC